VQNLFPSKRQQQPYLRALLNARVNYLYIFPKKNYKLNIYSISFAGFLISAKCHILSSFNIRFGETLVIELKNSEYRSNLINHVIIACFVWFAIFIGVSSNVFASAPQHSSAAECHAKIQRIETTQSNPNQEMQRPAQDWVTLDKLPDQWGKRWPGYHSKAWYKIIFSYNCQNPAQNSPLALTIESITQTGQVFINNNLLWQDISTEEPIARNAVTPHLWNIPASSLHQGENVLWVQVQGCLTQKSGLGQVLIGDYASIYQAYSKWIFEKKTLPYLNAMLNLVIAIICFLVWVIARSDSAFLWFALVSIAWVLYSTLVVYSDPLPYLNSTDVDRLQNIIFCFYVVAGCLGAWRFARKSFPKIEKILYAFAFCGAAAIALAPDAYINQTMQVFFGIAVLIFLAKCLTYPYIAYKSKITETYFMSVTYLVFIPIAINDAIFMTTLQGQPLSPYTAPFSSMSIGIILAFRLARDSREIAAFNKTLNENIIRAKSELTESLGVQHKLALENARLQERIHLSHDLHDGLGGSIVRSIITLERDEQINKPQVMSILKMLRSDLRQVIDTGSSLSAKVPDTPIEWAAPIRHRFVQLFEEIEILSQWSFEPTWEKLPTALQCLTLTRVAEEALTNILKHSQASKVSVSLTQTGNHELLMRIHDNGAGFDPKTVDAGLHVGLQSMRARISRLGGTFDIASQFGSTSIQVSLPLAPKHKASAEAL
jgi:signal transduction histidine kinase